MNADISPLSIGADFISEHPRKVQKSNWNMAYIMSGSKARDKPVTGISG